MAEIPGQARVYRSSEWGSRTQPSSDPTVRFSPSPSTALRCLACCLRSTTKRAMKALRGCFGFIGDASTLQHFPRQGLTFSKKVLFHKAKYKLATFMVWTFPLKVTGDDCIVLKACISVARDKPRLRSQPPVRSHTSQLPGGGVGVLKQVCIHNTQKLFLPFCSWSHIY